MSELNEQLYSKIQALSALGDKLAEKGNYSDALIEYWKAYNLIPEPKTDWEATT